MDFGVGQTPVDVNIKIACVERTMAGEEAAAAAQAPDEPGFLYNVHWHMPKKSAFAEEVQTAAEAVKPVTAVDSEKNDVEDGVGGGSSYSKSGDSEDLVEVVSEKPDTGEVLGGVQLYELVAADKARFTDMVTRHASRA